MRTVFMGSPDFAVPSLVALAACTEVVAVVCQPDKPAGRGLELLPPAVKQKASELGLPVLQPQFLRPHKSDFVQVLSALAPDLVVVTAYGKILPSEVLRIPRLGCWNVHASILPKYRGAAPIQWALLRGESETGVTLMQMDEGMDTGAMLLKQTLPIQDSDTSGTLHDSLSHLGAGVLGDGLRLLLDGKVPAAVAQESAQATMAPKLEKEHGRLDFTRSTSQVLAQLRGVDPWPGAFTTLPAAGTGAESVILKVFSGGKSAGRGAPGQVLGVDRQGLHVACGDGAVALCELQLPGRKRMAALALTSGFAVPVGSILGGGLPNALL